MAEMLSAEISFVSIMKRASLLRVVAERTKQIVPPTGLLSADIFAISLDLSLVWGQCYITLIYCDSRIIPPFYVIKQYYDSNYCGMEVNCSSIIKQ
jgi:hypothetical protein